MRSIFTYIFLLSPPSCVGRPLFPGSVCHHTLGANFKATNRCTSGCTRRTCPAPCCRGQWTLGMMVVVGASTGMHISQRGKIPSSGLVCVCVCVSVFYCFFIYYFSHTPAQTAATGRMCEMASLALAYYEWAIRLEQERRMHPQHESAMCRCFRQQPWVRRSCRMQYFALF